MNKFLFHYPILNVGGAELSTLRLIRALADRGWDVTLVLTTGGGSLEDQVDCRARIVRLRPYSFGTKFAGAKGWFRRIQAVPDLAIYILMRLIGAVRMLTFLGRRYDAAATMLHSTSPFFVTRVVNAGVRFHWIRSDLRGADKNGVTAARLASAADLIDHFVCVSRVTLDSFIQAVPKARGKVHLIYNVLDAAQIQVAADRAPDPFPLRRQGELRILTVGRLSDRDKAIFRLARVCKALVERGHPVRWFLVGAGPDQAELQKRIEHEKLLDTLVLVGEKRDPFPYYRHADLIAVLSNHEGLCGVINEAKVAGRAVIATKMSGVDEQLTHRVNGYVVRNDEQSIIDGMSLLLSDQETLLRITNDDYPADILNDELKLDRIEHLALGSPVIGINQCAD